MNFLAYVATMWVALGGVFWVALVIMENETAIRRSPRIPQTKNELDVEISSRNLLVRVIHYLAVWPWVFWRWLQASRRGHSLLESVAIRQDEIHEILNLLNISMNRASYRLTQALKGGPNRFWMAFGFPTESGDTSGTYIRVGVHGTSLVLTHLVIPHPIEGHYIIRMGVPFNGGGLPSPEDYPPDLHEVSLETCVDVCDQDLDWIALCSPQNTDKVRDQYREANRKVTWPPASPPAH